MVPAYRLERRAISLSFNKIEVEYKVFKANRSIGETVKVTFDLENNAGLSLVQ